MLTRFGVDASRKSFGCVIWLEQTAGTTRRNHLLFYDMFTLGITLSRREATSLIAVSANHA